jgi:hypothetical protein
MTIPVIESFIIEAPNLFTLAKGIEEPNNADPKT